MNKEELIEKLKKVNDNPEVRVCNIENNTLTELKEIKHVILCEGKKGGTDIKEIIIAICG